MALLFLSFFLRLFFGLIIIDKTHIDGLYLNCGWCYGGFKSTPVSGWTFAHTIAQDRPHELNSELSLNRWAFFEIHGVHFATHF